LGDEPTEGLDTSGLLATAEDFGTVYVKRRQVGPCPATRILVFDASGTVRARWQGGMYSQETEKCNNNT